MTNKIHTDSNLGSANPQYWQRYPGIITRTIYSDKSKFLVLEVKRSLDSLVKSIMFHNHCPFGEADNLRIIEGLYEDFEVEEHSQLVGREVVGVYYQHPAAFEFGEKVAQKIADRLIGIQKI